MTVQTNPARHLPEACRVGIQGPSVPSRRRYDQHNYLRRMCHDRGTHHSKCSRLQFDASRVSFPCIHPHTAEETTAPNVIHVVPASEKGSSRERTILGLPPSTHDIAKIAKELRVTSNRRSKSVPTIDAPAGSSDNLQLTAATHRSKQNSCQPIRHVPLGVKVTNEENPLFVPVNSGMQNWMVAAY